MEQVVKAALGAARESLDSFYSNEEAQGHILKAAECMAAALSAGKKIISCGNGGSLCDAAHFAEELTGRFRRDRRPLPAMAINDPAYITCVGNDYSFDEIFSRYVEGMGQPGDVLLAITTSGKSANVQRAVEMARKAGMHVVALTSERGLPLLEGADIAIAAPDSEYSDRVQEIHIKVIHLLVQLIEIKLNLSQDE